MRLIFLFLISSLFFFSCEKESAKSILSSKEMVESNYNDNYYKNSIKSEYLNLNKDDLALEYFINYLNGHIGYPLKEMLPNLDVDRYKIEIKENENKITEIGFDNYIEKLMLSGAISSDVAYLFTETYKDPDLLLSNEKYFARFKTPNYERDPLYHFFFYSFLEIRSIVVKEVENGNFSYRDSDCGWGQLWKSIVRGASAGLTSTVWTLEPCSMLIGVGVGAIIGGVEGAISFEKCDCGKVTHFYTDPSNDCNGTVAVTAVGDLDEVISYRWLTEQNAEVKQYFTSFPTLGVTQYSENNPITVSVIPICKKQRMGSGYGKEFNFMDFSLGNIFINVECCCNSPRFDDEPDYGCTNTYHSNQLNFGSTNDFGLVDYSLSIENGSYNNGYVSWNNPGNASITVTAVQLCTGETATKTINLIIEGN